MTRHCKIIAFAAAVALLCVGAASLAEKKADNYVLTVLNTPDSSRWESEVNSADHKFASKHGGLWSMTILTPIKEEFTDTSFPLLHPGKNQPESVCLLNSDFLSDDSSEGGLPKKVVSDNAITGFTDKASCEKTRSMLDRQELDREKIREKAGALSNKWTNASENLHLASMGFGGCAVAWLCMRLLFIGWLAFIRATAKAIRGD